MKSVKLVFLAVVWAGLAACGSAAADNGVNALGAGPAANPSYYTVNPDPRNCIAPGCGGFFLKQVNQEATPCPDGSVQSECYVGRLDLRALRLSPDAEIVLQTHASQFLLRGTMVQQDDQGVFIANEAWRGHEGRTPSGSFYRVTNSGITCITYPCPSYNAERLNTAEPPQSLADIFLDQVTPDPANIRTQLHEPEGVLAAGSLVPVTGPAGTASALQASEAYIPYQESQPSLQAALTAQLTQKSAACDLRRQCGEGMYCRFLADDPCGRADGPGICALRPQLCTQIYAPVCGCNGQTYSNACQAAGQGVNVEYAGQCNAS